MFFVPLLIKRNSRDTGDHDEQLTASPVPLSSSPARGLHCFSQRGSDDRDTPL